MELPHKSQSSYPEQQETEIRQIINQNKMTHEGLQHQILSIGESFSQFRLWACLFFFAHLSAMREKKFKTMCRRKGKFLKHMLRANV